VHEHVDAAPPLFGFAHHRGDIVGFRDIGPNRRGLTASRGRRLDHIVRLLGTGPVVDNHAKSPLRED
jgi:hypothetical protein